MTTELTHVSVGEGFLPKFADEFLDLYGPDSLFARALSDINTIAVSRMLERAGQLAEDAEIALFAPKEATDCLKHLISLCPDFEKLYFQEPLGSQPVGSIASAVDASFGRGVFDTWLGSLENENYDGARECLRRIS